MATYLTRVIKARALSVLWYRQLFFCLFVSFFGSTALHGQSPKAFLDSLLLRTPSELHDSIYYELFKKYCDSDISHAKYYIYRAQELSIQLGHFSMLAKSYDGLGYLYEKTNRLDSATFWYKKGLEVGMISDLPKRVMFSSARLGAVYDRRALYDSAFHYYNGAFELAMELKNYTLQVLIKHNTGLINYYLHNLQEALTNFQEADRIADENEVAYYDAIRQLNTALVYIDIGNRDKASAVLRRVKEICSKECDDYTLGQYYYALALVQPTDEATDAFQNLLYKALYYADLSNDLQTQAYSYYHLASLRHKQGDFDGSLENAKKAEALAGTLRHKRLLKEIYRHLSDVYHKKGSFGESLRFEKMYSAIKDSIFNETVANNIRKVQFEAQNKETALMLKAKDQQIRTSHIIVLLVVVICLLLIVISLLIYRSWKASRSYKSRLEDEIFKRTFELERRNHELSKSHLEFNHLIYETTHHVHAPLATLMGLANLSQYSSGEELKEIHKKIFEIGSTELRVILAHLQNLYKVRDEKISLESIEVDSFTATLHGELIGEGLTDVVVVADEAVMKPICSDIGLLTQLVVSSVRYFAAKRSSAVKVFLEQHDNNTIISVAGGLVPLASVSQEQMLHIFVAQLTAFKLNGYLVQAEHDGRTIIKIIVPNAELSSRRYSEAMPVYKEVMHS